MLRLLTSRGWLLFLVVTVALGLAGGGYAAWTTALRVEGIIETGSVGAAWDQQSERELVGVVDPATGEVVEVPIEQVPVLKDVADCVSDLDPGETAQVVNFQVTNAYPSYTCEITLGAIITGSIPVHIASIERTATDEAGEDVLDEELSVGVAVTRKAPDGTCDPSQPLGVSSQLHSGDRICVIIRLHVEEQARMAHVYQGSVTVGLVQWNLAGMPSEDLRPIARIAANPNPASCGQSVTLDAAGSTIQDPSRTIIRYEWDLDYDGQVFDTDASGVEVQRETASFGVFTVALLVTDDNVPPRTDLATLEIASVNAPPIASAGGPYSVAEGESLTLDATASSDPNAACGDSIAFYEWDINNDGVFDDAVGATPTLPFEALQALGVGTHTIALRVTDANGDSATDTTSLTITSGGPAVGPVASLELTASSPHRADGQDASDIVVRASDASGQPVPGASIALLVTAGRDFSQPLALSDRGDGTYTASLTSTSADTYTLVARHVPSGASDSARVEFIPTGLESLSLTSVQPVGTPVPGTALLAISGADAQGNAVPIDPQALQASTDLGFLEGDPDRPVLLLTADRWGIATVQAEAGGVSAATTVPFGPARLGLPSGNGLPVNAPFDVALDLWLPPASLPQAPGAGGADLLGAYRALVTFDPATLQLVSVADGDGSDGYTPPQVEPVGPGQVTLSGFNQAGDGRETVNAALLTFQPLVTDIHDRLPTVITIEGLDLITVTQQPILIPEGLVPVPAPVVLKPVKEIKVTVWVVDGQASEADVNADIARANEIFTRNAANCHCDAFISLVASIRSISADDWDNIDDDDDGLFDDGEADELPEDASAVSNVYYTPGFDGDVDDGNTEGIMGTTTENSGVAVNNASDPDNRTLAHELAHDLSNEQVVDSPADDDNDQGARDPGNLMNYDDTGDDLTETQCDLITGVIDP